MDGEAPAASVPAGAEAELAAADAPAPAAAPAAPVSTAAEPAPSGEAAAQAEVAAVAGEAAAEAAEPGRRRGGKGAAAEPTLDADEALARRLWQEMNSVSLRRRSAATGPLLSLDVKRRKPRAKPVAGDAAGKRAQSEKPVASATPTNEGAASESEDSDGDAGEGGARVTESAAEQQKAVPAREGGKGSRAAAAAARKSPAAAAAPAPPTEAAVKAAAPATVQPAQPAGEPSARERAAGTSRPAAAAVARAAEAAKPRGAAAAAKPKPARSVGVSSWSEFRFPPWPKGLPQQDEPSEGGSPHGADVSARSRATSAAEAPGAGGHAAARLTSRSAAAVREEVASDSEGAAATKKLRRADGRPLLLPPKKLGAAAVSAALEPRDASPSSSNAEHPADEDVDRQPRAAAPRGGRGTGRGRRSRLTQRRSGAAYTATLEVLLGEDASTEGAKAAHSAAEQKRRRDGWSPSTSEVHPQDDSTGSGVVAAAAGEGKSTAYVAMAVQCLPPRKRVWCE